MNERELHSLIALLDDDDQEVLEHVRGRLLSLGKDAIPALESAWSKLQNATQQNRLIQIVHRIQYSELLKEFRDWYRLPEHDLLTGIFSYLCKIPQRITSPNRGKARLAK